MKIPRFTAVATLLCALSAPALALPPPLPVAITYLNPDDVSPSFVQQADALRAAVAADNWFEELPTPTVDDPALAACYTAPDPEACFRADMVEHKQIRPTRVLVVLEPRPGDRVAVRCVGADPGSGDPARKSVEIDLAHPTTADRSSFAACVVAAAAESGW